jgi:hypothetical protein
MPLEHIRHEVRLMLDDVNYRLAEAERQLATGTLRGRVDAAGELVFLRDRKAIVETRLKEIEALPASASETPWRWLKEELFNLKVQLQSWVAGG